jgi:cell division protein FtsL
MPGNLALRLSAVGEGFISRNRKLGRPWRLGRTLVTGVVLATLTIMVISIFSAWRDLHYITLSYQISQAQETQKQYLDLNRKLRLELANLTAISRLERLAGEYGMGAPQPSQVVSLP